MSMSTKEMMRIYYQQHDICPACKTSKSIMTTCASCLDLYGGPYRDTNKAECHGCGWVGIVDDMLPKEKQDGQA